MDLAIRDSVKCRELIESDWYQNTFRPSWKLSKNQNAKSHFRNTEKGERYAVSVGGRVTGFRGDCVLIDDPLNAMDAFSPLKRQQANVWLDQAASNRVNDPRSSSMVIIMQRLHHEDVSGHVLEQGAYEHLCLPSRYEPERRYSTCIGMSDPRQENAEPLFPEMYTPAVLDYEEKRMGSLAFAGQHQQIPTPATGNMLKAEMLCQDSLGKRFWDFPAVQIMEAYFGWDTANKTKTTNDYTAGCLTMLGADGYVYLVPVTLERMEVPQVVVRIVVEWARRYQRLGEALRYCRVEEGAGTSPVQFLMGLAGQESSATPPSPLWTQEEWNMVRCAPSIRLEPFTTRQDKVSRVAAVLPYFEAKRVRLVDTSLSRLWLEQLLAFDLGAFDDAVDATVVAIEPFACKTAEASHFEKLLKSLEYDP